jgi:hypothetical protein
LLLEVSINFENLTDFKLVYANKHTLDSDFSLIDFNSNTINATNTISFDLVRLEAMKRQHDEVTQFINGALDASRNELISSPSRTAITIDELGLRARSYNWNTGQPTGLEAWLTGSQLAFSDDSFTTARLALGRVNLHGSAGGSAYGLVADVVVGTLLAGNELHIRNKNNNFRLDETGAWLDNANFTITRTQGGVTNRIVLDPIEGFAIFRGNERQIFLDANGNAVFRGQIIGGSININSRFMVDSNGNVTITQGSIDLGGGRFRVDSNGNVTASNATIQGTINSSTINGGSILGSFVNIGNGAAVINSNGNAVFNDIHIRNRSTYNVGNFLGGGNGFRVDENGNVFARNAYIEGDIFASTVRGCIITGTTVNGGTINGTSIIGGTIDIDTNARVGNFLTLGSGSQTGIIFGISGARIDVTDFSRIRITNHLDAQTVSAFDRMEIRGRRVATIDDIPSTANLVTRSEYQAEVAALWRAINAL